MAKSPCCAETTHCSNWGCTPSVGTTYSVATVAGISSTLEEMLSLTYFLNHRSIPAPLSHMRLCLSLSILQFESVKVGQCFIQKFLQEGA